MQVRCHGRFGVARARLGGGAGAAVVGGDDVVAAGAEEGDDVPELVGGLGEAVD